MPTFASLIRDLAQMVGAVRHESTATGGTTTTLADTVELAGYADDTFNDLRVYIFEGTGLGQERRITDFATAGTLTFAVGTAPNATSKYIILNTGWTVSALRQALIQALRWRRKYLLEPMVDESLTLDTDLVYTVPTGFAAIQTIWRESDVGSGLFNLIIPPDYWYINRAATRQICFEPEADLLSSFVVSGCKLRLVGQKYETEPTTDADVVSVQTGSLLVLAATLANLRQVAIDPTNSRRNTAQASILLQEFQRTFFQDTSLVAPGSKLVDE